MNPIRIPLSLEKFDKESKEYQVLSQAEQLRSEAEMLAMENRWLDAMERTVTGLRTLRDFPDITDTEFRALLAALLFDLAEIHFSLKNYKQSEKELETLFKVLDHLVKLDKERFGEFHILAMELSTRILRSRKKAMDLLVKLQMTTGALYDKVNSGMAEATDKLVDALRNAAQLLASTGDLKAALKFYAEAIKFSKKRTGRVTEKEIRMTVEMAETMIRIRTMRPRAKRLLEAVTPHAVNGGHELLVQDIKALEEVIGSDDTGDSIWKVFLHKITSSLKKA